MKIVLTGGGTAGHVMPHIALLGELKKNFKEIHYLGSKTGVEKSIISEKKEVFYHEIDSVRFTRGLNFKNLLIPFRMIKLVSQCKKILKKIKPNIIFSKGGYVAVPVCIAAKKLKIPVVSHESDLTLGLANKVIYNNCKAMCCSFEKTASYGKKCIHTGSAIRKELISGNKSKFATENNLNKNIQTILFMGGSLGATRINELVLNSKDELLKNYNIIHLCGKGKKIESTTKQANGKYVQIEFEKNPANLFACADIVVCRAGSNTIFEMLALSKPMLLLPLSKKASRGDQILNSKEFKQSGFASYILDEDLNKETLVTEIENLINNKQQIIKKMKASNFQLGNEKILSIILKNKK